ncbi:MAG: PDZ domain-containing protein [Candidatus Cloacimonetes bacterium]|nr:PDZ domain-containing protein [Candidatus Cloacimonadota bacterium]MCF7813929.1 PDZ domain-containing protein [Candidatus Cloacimonadota bacterium]MCF7868023.1 PDZ domain-containing protein [Candidatus Cloacimonadota bacterium]MCF7884769.1 PDZ domain-containing protein [Candidatus Cloacimonadota bacterium]
MKNILMFFILIISINLFSQNFEDLNELSAKETFQYLSNWNEFDQPVKTGILVKDSIAVNDTLIAPFAYYIPSNYKATERSPLFVYLHGGVGIPEFYPIEDLSTDDEFAAFAEENNMLALFPSANMYCMWWDVIGAENILNQIKLMKRKFNVDDDRVFVSGISDGGSGSFHLAMTRPDAFASFYPIIGMLSVGNLENGMHSFPTNMKNRFVSAVNNNNDGLYPTKKMRKLMNIAQEAGADLFYKEIWGPGHEVPYLENHLKLMKSQMHKHPRDAFQPELFWEVAEPEFSKSDWLEITQIDTLQDVKEWHEIYNVKLTDNRMMFGFNHDQEYEGMGTKITNIVENSAAEDAGLQVADIIIGMDGKEAANIDSLVTWRDAKQRGDEFSLTVLRDGEEVVLKGRFPRPTEYDAFRFSKASGAVKARYYGNIFEIETSRVKEIALYFHPEMINLEIPVIVNINGQKVFHDTIDFDKDLMIQNYQKCFDRKALWINKLTLNVPEEV